jgi:hypothetical protein
MACCQEKQTECLKVVTIGYLKNFIGTYLHSSVDDSVLGINGLRDDYCPTYGELVNGIIIQTAYTHPSDAKYDVDGIVVNSTYTGGSAATPYNDSQEVNQKDLSIRYTTLNNINISLSKSVFDACGDSATTNTTYTYTRYSKSMNSSCSTVGPTAVETKNGVCGDLSWFTTYGNVENCNKYTIDKNTLTAQRTDSVYAKLTWRGKERLSNTLSPRQNGNTGGQWIETSSSASNYRISDCQNSPSLLIESTYIPESKHCIIPAQTLNVTAVSSATITTYYVWKDGCGDIDYDTTSSSTKPVSGNISSSYDLTEIKEECCYIPTSGISVEIPVTVSVGDVSCTKTFTARSNSCSSEEDCKVIPTPEECNGIYGYNTIFCFGQAQYTAGMCGEDDPVYDAGVVDNVGKVWNPKKTTCPGWEDFAPPKGNWWSGPHDGDDADCDGEIACSDCGLRACGDAIGDGIRYGYGKNIGTGVATQVREYHSPDLNIVSNDDWITFSVEVYTGPKYPQKCGPNGMIHWTIAKNTTRKKRVGTATITSSGGSCGCTFGEVKYNNWAEEMTVYFYQRETDYNKCPRDPQENS